MRLFVIDAFTDVPFHGNPAGVVLLEAPAEPSWMQDVAAELKHSETAFVRRRDDGDHDLRWFTPTVEVDLCGHATLATAHALASSGQRGPFAFHTRSGVLRCELDAAGVIDMEFPAQPGEPIDAPAGLADALGVTPTAVASNGIDVLVEVDDAAEVAKVVPDFERLRGIDCRGVIVTAKADAGATHDFVSRFFAPRVGVDEDPVTGSAHCKLAPYWSQRLGRTSLVGVQLSPRGGRIELVLHGDRVRLRGRATTVVQGELVA